MKTDYFNVGYRGTEKGTELALFRQFFNKLIEWGFTCDTTVDDQCVTGNIPSFTFTWPNGKSFTMTRNAATESTASNSSRWNISIDGGSYVFAGFQRYNNRSMLAEYDYIEVGLRIFFDDDNFWLNIGGYGHQVTTLFTGAVVGWITDSNDNWISIGGAPNIANIAEVPRYLDFVIFKNGNGQQLSRMVKLPKTDAGYIYVSDYFTIGTDPSSMNWQSSNYNGAVVEELNMIKTCSFINPPQKLKIDGKKYMTLDGYALIAIE